MTDETLDDIRKRKARELIESESAGGTEQQETPSDPIHVEGATEFEQVLSDHEVVLVDFHAEWCGPCKMIAPVVEELAAETDATIAKVDVDTNQQLASKYGVRGVPTLILFADGEPVEQLTGMTQKPRLTQLIEQYT